MSSLSTLHLCLDLRSARTLSYPWPFKRKRCGDSFEEEEEREAVRTCSKGSTKQGA